MLCSSNGCEWALHAVNDTRWLPIHCHTVTLPGDVRLDNLLVEEGEDGEGRVVLIDFGFSTACSNPEEALTEEDELCVLLATTGQWCFHTNVLATSLPGR